MLALAPWVWFSPVSFSKNSGCGDAASIIAGDVRQFGRRVPYAEMVARIDAITKKEIQAVSHVYVSTSYNQYFVFCLLPSCFHVFIPRGDSTPPDLLEDESDDQKPALAHI